MVIVQCSHISQQQELKLLGRYLQHTSQAWQRCRMLLSQICESLSLLSKFQWHCSLLCVRPGIFHKECHGNEFAILGLKGLHIQEIIEK